MSAADVALLLFTACNSARIMAYVPQLFRVARDSDGARAISYLTWVLFAISNLSTVGYALFVVHDLRIAAVFGANAISCAAIVAITAYKRVRVSHARRHCHVRSLVR
jgi:hypothetical protein